MGTTDMSLVKDLTAYVPAPIPGAKPAEQAATANPADAEGQVRSLILGTIEASIKGDFDKVLDAFQPEHVAALRDDAKAMQALRDTYEKTITLMRVIGSKTGQEMDPSKADIEQFMKLANDQLKPMGMSIDLKELIKVEVRDATNATVTMNPPKMPAAGAAPPEGLTPEQLAGYQAAQQAAQQAAAQQAASGTPAPQAPPILVSKQGEKWLIQLPMPLTSEMVKEARKALNKFAKPILDKLAEKIDAMETTDPAALQQIMMKTIMETYSQQLVAEDEEEEESDFVPAPSPSGDTDKPKTGGEGGQENPPPPPPTPPDSPSNPRNPRRPGGG
ncbi:MAG: hypothetical protein JNG88_11995 [Phycisphaerales bacterium]|nr:hypothetical protein [Phycisphaerales bacterium]